MSALDEGGCFPEAEKYDRLVTMLEQNIIVPTVSDSRC
jgi:hypothetical protein